MTPADEELLERFNAGDADAFARLLERYRRPIYNFIYRSTRDRERSEDLTQDVFLRLVQRSAEFKGQSKFSTWLYTIARNLCIDHGRKMVFRQHRSLDAPARGGEEDGPSLGDRVKDGGPGVHREAVGNVLRTRIAEAVEALPDDQREVFLLRHLENMPFKDIAAVVGAPENTVKSRMRYALERLQEALSEFEDYGAEAEERA